ncbi:hypothetical protein QYM36_012275 [Artemia franciscana]|uniref:Protein kinase domain-containing protein n=1 Tax=Artemia franciscana TaxID=6661 RepID=A0AA88HIQ4_ARTSF|nr:hypothetical protein QYM36_012275 [Artemia franciscana]
MPKNVVFKHGNDAKSTENRHNYKKKLYTDFTPIQKIERSNTMHQFGQCDDHLNKRTEMLIYDKPENTVHIKSILSKMEYKKLANLTPIIKEVMIELRNVVYSVSAVICCYKNKVKRSFDSIQRKAVVGMKNIIDRVKAMISQAKCDNVLVPNINHLSSSSCNPVKSLRTSIEMFNDDFCLSETVIGKGRNGEVLLASYRQCNRKKVAVKIVKLEDNVKVQDPISGVVIPIEIYWLKKVQNIEGCQKCVAFYFDEKNAVIVTEYQENTVDLCKFIYDMLIPIKEQIKHEVSDRCLSECEVIKKFQKEILNECEVLIIFQQIVSIVARLEECGIIHGDLKADNILIDGNFKVTLIDFDASTYMEEKIVKGALRFDNIYPPSELKGHHQRMKEKYNTHKYEFISESDKKIAEEMTRLYEIGPVTTWTLGAILAQLLLLEPIIFWESTDLKALESKISASSISPPVKNLLFMCLNQDPNKRPNTKEILEYLYLNLPYIINNKKEISKKLESERFSIKITANPKAEVEFFPARRSCA